jgi:hypothetical protein
VTVTKSWPSSSRAIGAKVDYQVAAPAEIRTPSLRRAKNRSTKSAMEGWRQKGPGSNVTNSQAGRGKTNSTLTGFSWKDLRNPVLMSGQIVWSTTRICSSFIRPPCTVIPERAVSILTEILRLQLNAACSKILAQVIHIACAWNRNNVRRSTWNGIAAIPPGPT